MHDLVLVFFAGLLGSAHCIGMCGGFVLTISNTRGKTSGLLHQGAYFFGKSLTYALLGVVAGAAGSVLSVVTGLQHVLSILAGVAMLVIGLGLIGVLDRIEGFGRLARFPAYQRAMAYFLRERTFSGTLGLGMLNGLLPCGLVYGVLMKAASTGSATLGAATMFVFGIATIPALFLLGLTGHMLQPVWRQRLNLASGIVVLLLAGTTILRATPAIDTVMGALHGPGHSRPATEHPIHAHP